jgi:predicted ATP-dependent serine protease
MHNLESSVEKSPLSGQLLEVEMVSTAMSNNTSSNISESKNGVTFYSLKQILEDTSTPPDPIIGNGILNDKTLLLISGKKKAGKSMLSMNMGLAIATGTSFSIFEIKKIHSVLMLSSEGGYWSNRDRLQIMCKRLSSNSEVLFDVTFDPRIYLDSKDGILKIKQILTRYRPQVLIIDPLIKFHKRDENSANEMNVVMTAIRNLIEDFNLSVILIHHMGKDGNNGPRGSSVILGEYDSSLEIKGEIKKNKEISLIFDMRHVESPEDCKIVFNKDTLWFDKDIKKLSTVGKVVEQYGTMKRSELVKHLVDTSKYSEESNAYKAINKSVTRKELTLDNYENVSLL